MWNGSPWACNLVRGRPKIHIVAFGLPLIAPGQSCPLCDRHMDVTAIAHLASCLQLRGARKSGHDFIYKNLGVIIKAEHTEVLGAKLVVECESKLRRDAAWMHSQHAASGVQQAAAGAAAGPAAAASSAGAAAAGSRDSSDSSDSSHSGDASSIVTGGSSTVQPDHRFSSNHRFPARFLVRNGVCRLSVNKFA